MQSIIEEDKTSTLPWENGFQIYQRKTTGYGRPFLMYANQRIDERRYANYFQSGPLTGAE
jgi:hypothetical protein